MFIVTVLTIDNQIMESAQCQSVNERRKCGLHTHTQTYTHIYTTEYYSSLKKMKLHCLQENRGL
jgi:hypothetical protein